MSAFTEWVAAMLGDDVTWFDGPCDIPACPRRDAHGHVRCLACGSVGYRNSACDSCLAAWGGQAPDDAENPCTPVSTLRAAYRAQPCPECGAPAGRRCVTPTGWPRSDHLARTNRAMVARNSFGWRGND
jgi:hypothetical protein